MNSGDDIPTTSTPPAKVILIDGGAAPKRWYRSESIRKSCYLGISALVTLVKLFGYDRKFGLGINLVSLDDLTGAVMFVLVPLAAGGTALWLSIWGILRRVKNGKDPFHPAAPISTPDAVVAVERLTGNIPKPPAQ